jgi:drug/metabolite transporter (DMT)-like permease
MWALFAIMAAILWGIDYALTEKALLHVSFSVLLCIELFIGFLVMLGITFFTGSISQDFAAVFSSNKTSLLVLVIVIAFNLANIFIVLSIKSNNATVSGLIEISYPFFIALFSWLLFRDNNLNAGAISGGIFILAGVSLIYLTNR